MTDRIRAQAEAADREAAAFLRRCGYYNNFNEPVETETVRQAPRQSEARQAPFTIIQTRDLFDLIDERVAQTIKRRT